MSLCTFGPFFLQTENLRRRFFVWNFTKVEIQVFEEVAALIQMIILADKTFLWRNSFQNIQNSLTKFGICSKEWKLYVEKFHPFEPSRKIRHILSMDHIYVILKPDSFSSSMPTKSILYYFLFFRFSFPFQDYLQKFFLLKNEYVFLLQYRNMYYVF